MEVILLERINRLGSIGETVRVKDGYGRNFLIPRKKALRATQANKAVFEQQRAEIEAQNADAKAAAEAQAKQIEGLNLTITRQASDEGKLFGGVTLRDISEALSAKGHDVPKSQIVIPNTIKTTGAHPVKIQLHAEVVVTLDVEVARNDAEA